MANAVERQYKADTDEENQLSEAVEREKQRDFALNDASLRMPMLAREVETNRQLYKSVLLRMQQIRVGQASARKQHQHRRARSRTYASIHPEEALRPRNQPV